MHYVTNLWEYFFLSLLNPIEFIKRFYIPRFATSTEEC